MAASAAAVAALVAMSGHNFARAAAPDTQSGIAWQLASSDTDVDRAFTLAKQTGKPVFLYWGAVWCPPCNQVKATLFNRPDFIERSRAFVPVYVDGDKQGAQKVAARFKVAGYPTMVLFKPDGSEITRLPGEVDPERYLLTLSSGLDAQVPVKELVLRGIAHKPLTPEQWRLLAFYSWDTDEQQVVKSSELGARLSELALAVPPELGMVKDRLALKAIAARSRADSGTGNTDIDADRVAVDALLNATEAARAQSDLLILYAEPIVKYLASTPGGRAALAAKWDSALEKALTAKLLSRADQVDALDAHVSLWKLIDGTEKLASQRSQPVIAEVQRIVAQTTDRYERQAVVPWAAHVLTFAGLLKESDALLKAELPRAVAPYYHMLGLAANAKERGDKQGALQWHEQAWRKSEGPATRLQWGTGYVRSIIQLTPDDSTRVAAAAGAVISDLQARGETFFERNQRSLQRMATQLTRWQGADSAREKIVACSRSNWRELAASCRPRMRAARTARACSPPHPQRSPDRALIASIDAFLSSCDP